MKTVLPSPTSPTVTRDNGELSSNQKIVWENIMMYYIKRETNLDENFQKSYTFNFGQFTKHMLSKLEVHED